MTDGKRDDWFGADTATFGDRLAAAREAMGLSQEDLADRLGVRRKTIAKWEDDREDPRANRVQMLAGMLGVSLMWLLTGEGDGIAGPDAEDEDAAGDRMALVAELGALRAEAADLAWRIGRVETKLRAELAGEDIE